ncbi:kinetochore component CENP-S-domain-containing protein [Leucosporidium creatinivorum]|uniref:Kinetochore component CENP-S-domain-containing protein n=1 Tax=Leucosporidium creatinivorum TaxID=106004 RepID=A0A1Y2EX15_9BASI|nr:kinetochore component CENP-S-domain-containing protein [Leucosporidium creatinivorum]
MAKGDADAEPLSRQSLKAACWYTVAKIAEEEESSNLPVAVSEHFVASLAELVFTQALTLGKDLEMFAKHANRTTVGVEDVKLAARRNDALYELLASEAVKHGLALADSKPKPKAAPRPKAAPKPKAPAKEKAAPKIASKAKGKVKAKMIVESEEEDEMDVDREEEERESDSEEEEVKLKPVKRVPSKKSKEG